MVRLNWLLLVAGLGLAGCNATQQPSALDDNRTVRLMEQYAAISADADAICAKMGHPAGKPGNADCHYRVGMAIIDRKERALGQASQVAPQQNYVSTVQPVEQRRSEPTFIELPKTCLVMPLGAAATVNCYN